MDFLRATERSGSSAPVVESGGKQFVVESMYTYWQTHIEVLKLCIGKSANICNISIMHGDIKEDIDIEQQLYEILRGKNFAVNCLELKVYRDDNDCKWSNSWKFGCCALTLRNSPL